MLKAMGLVNKSVFLGLLLFGTLFLALNRLELTSGYLFAISFFASYFLVIFAVGSFVLSGIVYLVQRRPGFMSTLYPINGIIAIIGCLVVLFL